MAPVPPLAATSSTRGPATLASITALAVHVRRKGRRAEVSYWDGNGSLASDMIESSKIDGCDWNMVPCWTFKAEIAKMFV